MTWTRIVCLVHRQDLDGQRLNYEQARAELLNEADRLAFRFREVARKGDFDAVEDTLVDMVVVSEALEMLRPRGRPAVQTTLRRWFADLHAWPSDVRWMVPWPQP